MQAGLLGTDWMPPLLRYFDKFQYQRIFDFSEPIEGPKEFQPNQELNYDFKIKIPQNLIKSPQLTGVLGAIESLSMINTMVKWYLIADLDIPGIDISNKIQINIG